MAKKKAAAKTATKTKAKTAKKKAAKKPVNKAARDDKRHGMTAKELRQRMDESGTIWHYYFSALPQDFIPEDLRDHRTLKAFREKILEIQSDCDSYLEAISEAIETEGDETLSRLDDCLVSIAEQAWQ